MAKLTVMIAPDQNRGLLRYWLLHNKSAPDYAHVFGWERDEAAVLAALGSKLKAGDELVIERPAAFCQSH